MSMLIAVNYHHIGEDSSPFQNMFPVSENLLYDQLCLLKKCCDFVSEQDIIDHIYLGRTLPERSCLVTFDDGLRSQYEKALPILNDLRIPGIFFVPTLPYVGKALQVHQVQWLRSYFPQELLLKKFAYFYEVREKIPFDMERWLPDSHLLQRQYKYDTLEQAVVKFLFTKADLGGNLRSTIVEDLFLELAVSSRDMVSNLYMKPAWVKEVASRGYLGFHSHEHNPYLYLSQEGISNDIKKGMEVFQSIGVNNPRSISYPYGLFSSTVAVQVKKAGFSLGFTLNRDVNRDLDSNPLLFGRFDSNDIPLGKSPIFDVLDNKLCWRSIKKNHIFE